MCAKLFSMTFSILYAGCFSVNVLVCSMICIAEKNIHTETPCTNSSCTPVENHCIWEYSLCFVVKNVHTETPCTNSSYTHVENHGIWKYSVCFVVRVYQQGCRKSRRCL